MTDDTAWPLAQHVCRTRYADLPASTIQSSAAILSTPWAACLAAAVHRDRPALCRSWGCGYLNRVRTSY